MNTQIIKLALILGTVFAPVMANAHGGAHTMPDGTVMEDHSMHADPEAADIKLAPAGEITGKHIVANVNGLVCDFCAQGIKKTLLKEPGVKDVAVDLTAKTVKVALADDAELPEVRLKDLLKEAGFDMTSYEVK